jgi:pyridoxal phosphate enzyme (YggS family)
MVDPVLEVLESGVRDLSEEYLPEGVTKRPPVDHKVTGLTWHFTGTLPPNKIDLVIESFDWIHSIDRLTFVRPLSEAIQKKGKPICVLIEVNPLGSKKRAGRSPGEIGELAEALVRIPSLRVLGLSLKNEFSMSKDDSVTAFQRMNDIHKKALRMGELPPAAKVLAMGTSRDFEEAILAGATMIRVGEALFGPRVDQEWSDSDMEMG